MTYQLYQGDCLDVLPTLAAGSVDAIICDPPYGTTACKWDSVIPFELMWRELKRIIKSRGAIVLFGSQPFTSALVMSNAGWFRHSLVFEKSHPTGHLNANRAPMRKHEDVVVFGRNSVTYNPQKTIKPAKNIRPATRGTQTENYGAFDPTAGRTEAVDVSFPTSIIKFK